MLRKSSAGYEHLVEIPEPEPEEIWADAICESDETATAESSGDEDDDKQYRYFQKDYVSKFKQLLDYYLYEIPFITK